MKTERQKRTNDPVGMRNRVLDVADRAFQATGYGGTSTQDLISAAGVTSGALHHHFPTKKALALAVIDERVIAEVEDTWVSTVREATSAREGILRVFETVAAALDEQGKVLGCPLGNLALELSLADADLRAALAGGYDGWRSTIAERIRADQERGGAGYAEDPEAFANVVVAMFSGAMVIAKAEQDTFALKACAAQLDAMMRR
ncbi:TetR/AcrR family transcriptional regulator [Mesorhizobium sp. 1M-11]|uniref:TetR/AcrR family transcriptional regulator n=1 Tax=Mesorhizobium sp. 1M-11 TaxID=1529006 RepID=UPI000ABE4E52|nr:TetR/AcrR family transcriptional regulator [Mesorhizobium sp. 1M-11]